MGPELFAVGISWRTAPVAVRERLAVPDDELTTVLTALKDVEDALVALHGNRERLSYLQRAAVAAASAARLARQRYGSGLIDFQTVLDTQRNQLAANHVRLYKALGGGWRSDGGKALPSPTPASP